VLTLGCHVQPLPQLTTALAQLDAERAEVRRLQAQLGLTRGAAEARGSGAAMLVLPEPRRAEAEAAPLERRLAEAGEQLRRTETESSAALAEARLAGEEPAVGLEALPCTCSACAVRVPAV
jgi:hypothetical protein